jgi:heme transport system substrate-binding protein
MSMYRTRILFIGFGALIAIAVGCVNAARAAGVNVDTVPDASRIVSIGGAVTEILYALGQDDKIVGVDTTSLYPPKVMKEKPSVGYMRQLSAEGVLGLRPTLILAIEGAGPKDVISVLKAAKVPMMTVPDTFTGEGIIDKIRIVARASGTGARGQCLIAKVNADLGSLAKWRSRIGTKKRVLFLLSFVNGRAMVSGHGTAADGIIHMAGAMNAIDGYEGYKLISDEAVIAAKPDVVLAMQRSGPGNVSTDTVFNHAAFIATPAAAHRAFVAMEGLYLLGFGPRSARAARDLAVTLYPELKSTPLPSERSGELSKVCAQ